MTILNDIFSKNCVRDAFRLKSNLTTLTHSLL
jgi:hypothetical protein